MWEVLALCRGAVGVFCGPCRLGKRDSGDQRMENRDKKKGRLADNFLIKGFRCEISHEHLPHLKIHSTFCFRLGFSLWDRHGLMHLDSTC